MSLIMKSGNPVDLVLKVNHSRVNVSAANREYAIVKKTKSGGSIAWRKCV